MKRSARGFEQVGHFFLSGSSSKAAEASATRPTTTPRRQADTVVAPGSGINPTPYLRTADAISGSEAAADRCAHGSGRAESPPLPRNAGGHLQRQSQACDCIGSTVARLEILQRSCQGATLAEERPSDSTLWFRGAAAIIQEAMATLSAMIHPVCPGKPCQDERDEAEGRT
jgi:hypothetical protein